MKRIRTSKPVGLPRFIYALIVCALIATVGVGSGIAADKNSKVTLVFRVGMIRPASRFVLWAAATSWLIAHAILHLWELLSAYALPRQSSVIFRLSPSRH